LATVVHGDTYLVGVGPQTTEIDALVYMWRGNILRLDKHGIISRKQHKIGIQLLWTAYTKSCAFFRMMTLPVTFEWPLTLKISYLVHLAPFCVSDTGEGGHFKFGALTDHGE